MLVNADARECVIDMMAYWTSHYLRRLCALSLPYTIL